MAGPGPPERLPPQYKTFETHAEAKRWAERLEGRIASDEFIDLTEAKRTTLGEAFQRCSGPQL